ncbi:hypothetical protein GX830_00955 [Candidatus Dojkabacteria bacterium]|nr:hypothetical protein [Candidatus Dojkabacteria bacterium]
MQIRIKKKSSILSVLIILFLVTASLSVYFLFFNKGKEEDDYDKLFKHCIEKENNKKECKVFLKKLRKEKDKVCMDIVLPEIEVEKRDITVCFNSNIEWEDPYNEYPYEQYFMTTPIVLTLEDGRKTTKSKSSEVDIRLMEYEEAKSVLEIKGLNSPDVSGIAFLSKDNYEFVSKGYTYSVQFIESQKDFFLHLDLIGIKILSARERDGLIEVEISFRMDDSSFNYVFESNQIAFFDAQALRLYDLKSQTDLDDYIDLDRYYLASFSLYDLNANSYLTVEDKGLDGRIHNYFNGKEDSNLRLTLETISK